MSAPTPTSRWFFPWLKEAQRALQNGDIRANAFAVLVVLSQFADYQTGTNARPGRDRLANDTGLSPRTVSDALKAGERAGLIKRVRRGFGNAGAGTASIYTLTASTPRPTSTGSPNLAATSATAPATASAINNTLPSTNQDQTDVTKSQERRSNSRKVRKPKTSIDWRRVGLTAETAQAQG